MGHLLLQAREARQRALAGPRTTSRRQQAALGDGQRGNLWLPPPPFLQPPGGDEETDEEV
ncbi:hypothetical protein [Phaffia rhodozyma]|uniref:Uncharacterized protein n=1 Tax=Phaffia rhodozyma TaxID=264483 RepID=A0A0F7SID0_PHARH|nr:hypothetical protein [Phaffia rhodozyma]